MRTSNFCTACGGEILERTAIKTGGLCMPCKLGTRAGIEAGKQYRSEEREQATDPFWQKWLELLERRKTSGFQSLSRPERSFFALNQLKGSVLRGGFQTYFSISSKEEIEAAIQALREEGATDIAAVVEKAITVLFPNGPPEHPGNEFAPEWETRIESVDGAFYDREDRIHDLVESFFARHWRASESGDV